MKPALKFCLFLLIGLLIACKTSSPPQDRITLTVSAAANLNEVFPQIRERWQEETGHSIAFNFGSTGQLAQQIERGAPIDLFAAANRHVIEDLDRKGLIESETKALYAIGQIILWQRPESALEITTLEDLLKPEIQRIALANPDHAPYGVAAREALQTLGLWDILQPKLIYGENVRQAQYYAETGNVDVAITALSLSIGKPGQWVLIPADLHQPLEQMLALPKNAPHPQEAREFASFIKGEQGRVLMEQYGFTMPEESEVRSQD
ncbi:molybdate ABC transporter substrate-binding protein [Spirulina subsalsa FACHB-351]|uniref:Molybdate ABC transporter substrate-binding protein n=1 Tax=Spirulina subsalsa FACHB-351 TaxID=234711 RepID=A0ABT3LB38_9CYAN|nr:molybdate ABC transporter substrate-binding protein [Spirulina subsalsa]MCW6038718.1 molybdate ABC transporter substrate-binding protein [Spirulina subsalsa FACHB-351]